MSLSILIVNWNSKDFLRRCLETVRVTCADPALQIVVVDAGSFDGCDQMLAAEFPEVEFIQSRDNIGFGRSNNLGLKKVKGDYLFLLNPDTEVKPGSLGALLSALREQPAAGIVAPCLQNTDGSLQTSCVRALPTPLNQALDCNLLRHLFPRSRMWGTWDAFSASQPVEVEAVSGACMLLRAETFRHVGGFSPDYFMYWEDMDLCVKVRRLGLKVYHVPAAKVVHHGGGSSSTLASRFSNVMMRLAGETYMRMNYGEGTASLYRLLQGLSALLRLSLLVPMVALIGQCDKIEAYASLQKWRAILGWAMGLPIRLSQP